VAVALITGGTTGFVGIAGLALNFWNSSSERGQRLSERREDNREWYRRTLFERRLRAVQEAYSWWRRLNEAVAWAGLNPDPASPENEAVRELAKRAREWHDNNSLDLEDRPLRSSHFLGLASAAPDWASGRRDMDIDRHLNDVYEFLRDRASRLLGSEDAEGMEAPQP